MPNNHKLLFPCVFSRLLGISELLQTECTDISAIFSITYSLFARSNILVQLDAPGGCVISGCSRPCKTNLNSASSFWCWYPTRKINNLKEFRICGYMGQLRDEQNDLFACDLFRFAVIVFQLLDNCLISNCKSYRQNQF